MAKKTFLKEAQQTISKPEADEGLDDRRPSPVGRLERQGRRLKGARELPLEKIKPDPNQPRTRFDPAALEELAQSIRKHGVRQPIEVEYIEAEDYFRIVSGERRYRASQIAGQDHIPCIVRDVADRDRLAIQLMENLQREDLSPIDKARGLLEYKQTLGPETQWKAVEELTGISERRRQQFLALLDLPEDIQQEIVALGSDRSTRNAITEKHARALLKLKKHPKQQRELFKRLRAGDESLSGSDAMKLAKQMLDPLESKPEKISFTYHSLPELIEQLKAKLAELEAMKKNS